MNSYWVCYIGLNKRLKLRFKCLICLKMSMSPSSTAEEKRSTTKPTLRILFMFCQTILACFVKFENPGKKCRMFLMRQFVVS